jgi:molybdenum cofactor biosynthesis enzyme MoaA
MRLTFVPSISLGVTSACNFSCIYCPPNGENLLQTDIDIIDVLTFKNVIKAARNIGINSIRLTGGEPLLAPKLTQELLNESIIQKYSNIILNTNGSLLTENIGWLEKFKEYFLLKISMDSICEQTFLDITNSNNKTYKRVVEGIRNASSACFKVEVNCVLNKHNVEEVPDLIAYVDKLGLDMKILDINRFGSLVEETVSDQAIGEILHYIKNKYCSLDSTCLPSGAGLTMRRYQLTRGGILKIVIHNGRYSSQKYYSASCSACDDYPCDCGRFQLFLRADGVLRTCRNNDQNSYSVNGLSVSKIQQLMNKMLIDFTDCYLA